MVRQRVADKALVCSDCGRSFIGYPCARLCPDCRHIHKLEAYRKQRQHGADRPLGSEDKCVICGKAYVVVGGRQKYCPDCKDEVYKETDRVGALKYYDEVKEHTNPVRNAARRKGPSKCAWCGKEFDAGGTKRKTCSEECRRLEYNRYMREARRRGDG